MYIIHCFDQFLKIIITVCCYRNQLRKYLVPLCLNLSAKFQRLSGNRLLEDHPDPIQPGITALLKMVDAARAIINHAYNHRIAAIQPSKYLLCICSTRHYRPINIKWTAIIKKTDFNGINAGAHQSFKNISDVVPPKFPVVDISSVTQSTVQQIALTRHFHVPPVKTDQNSLFTIQKPYRSRFSTYTTLP